MIFNERPNTLCQRCLTKKAVHKHHLFSNAKRNREIYGKIMDHPLNVMYLCYDCYLNHSIVKYDEAYFREIMAAAGIELPPLSKATGRCRRQGI